MAKPKLDEVLGYVPLFQDLPKRHLKQLASLCDVAEYMPDAAIVKEGEPGDAFYVVLKGQAKVTVHKGGSCSGSSRATTSVRSRSSTAASGPRPSAARRRCSW